MKETRMWLDELYSLVLDPIHEPIVAEVPLIVFQKVVEYMKRIAWQGMVIFDIDAKKILQPFNEMYEEIFSFDGKERPTVNPPSLLTDKEKVKYYYCVSRILHKVSSFNVDYLIFLHNYLDTLELPEIISVPPHNPDIPRSIMDERDDLIQRITGRRGRGEDAEDLLRFC